MTKPKHLKPKKRKPKKRERPLKVEMTFDELVRLAVTTPPPQKK